ncbi:hypothetical protein [Deinococcus sp. Leaf326]|uniref:hypothetical protein n=1 Tax=Deinococcus sp. Leaf326 TaxID=1736338 RepID=UPI000700BD2C|nr:hypothetical protein [Deinococcus sp. Leaf326]KQR35172.1 hypothetical protein ASF71_16455 [Deinococcus sp. Leaf326]
MTLFLPPPPQMPLDSADPTDFWTRLAERTTQYPFLGSRLLPHDQTRLGLTPERFAQLRLCLIPRTKDERHALEQHFHLPPDSLQEKGN